MYLPSAMIDRTTFFQGDIVKNFPFLVVDQEGNQLSVKKDIMLLSQTCDIQQRSQIIIAPIDPLEWVESNETKRQTIRARRTNYWFYLPQMDTVIQDSVVDLQMISYIPKQLVSPHLSSKVLSLSDWGRHHLAWALSTYFGRPILNK